VFLHITYPETRGEIDYPPERPIFSKKRFELVADTVCRDCNHHWMSDLETQASPLLTPMIEGEPHGLGLEQQVLLGRWITKTVLTWDQSMRPESRMYPAPFCRWLRDKQLPPPGAVVRLGKYEGSSRFFVYMSYEALWAEIPADLINPGPPDAHRTTIRIGQLMMEFTLREDAKAVVHLKGGDIADLLITVWPATDITCWPPRILLNDTTLQSFLGPDIDPADV
jgi:hypothetical protein